MKIFDQLEDYKKPREKAERFGVDTLSDEELIALIINTGNKNEDVISLSHRLLREVGGMDELERCSITELKNINGIGLSKACSLKAAFELKNRADYQSTHHIEKILTLQEAARFFKKHIGNDDKELFQVLFLNDHHEIIKFEILNKGTKKDVAISENEILSKALKYNTQNIIIAHNHPSNSFSPSNADIDFTATLRIGGSTVGVFLIDHLIITQNVFYSISKKRSFSYGNSDEVVI